jgi:hypothetical protein
MSIAEFSATIKSQAYRDWFQRISTEVILKTGVSELRESEQVASKTSFYITENTIKEVISALSGAQADPSDVEKVFQNLKTLRYNRNKKAIEKDKPFTDGKTLYYPRVSFDTIGTILEQGFKEVLTKAREKNPKVSIFDYFDRGHVFGIFPKKVQDIRDRLALNTTMDPKSRDLLLGILTDFYKELEKQDLETSNLKDETYDLYSRYKKKKDRYVVELQLKNVNQEAGRAQGLLSRAIRKFFNPGSLPVNKTGLNFTAGSGEQFLKKLIEGRGSPSLLDLVQEFVTDPLKGVVTKDKEFVIPFTKINSSTIKVNTDKQRKAIKKEKQNVKKLISSVKSVVPYKKLEMSTTSLATLMMQINSSLHDQLKKNMGTGNRRDVLNYRSGRFASSAKVERLSESRQGMVTAFYSYMKNPYATFSRGGRQDRPYTRDPKLLISKSIRELAGAQVANRMRAVLV